MSNKLNALEKQLKAVEETSAKKKSQIKAQMAQIKAKEKGAERKKDTRRKVLVGAMILDEYKKAELEEELKEKLSLYLIKPRDRDLFGLEPPQN